MDPVTAIGLIGSCVGISDGLAKICTLASQYIHRDRTVRQELGIWVFKLSQYKGIIDSIKLQVELDKEFEGPLRLSALGLVDGPLQSCKLATESLRKRLENLPRQVVAGKVVFGKVIDDKTAVALKMFDDTLPILQLALTSDQGTITSKVLDYVQGVKHDLENFVSQQNAEAEAKGKEELRDWLATLDPKTTCRKCLEGKSETSGRWFLDDKFHPWVMSRVPDDAKQVLWMRGASGMGKTTLLSLAVKHLSKEIGLGPDEGLAYFYCSSAIAESQKAENMLKSFIKQLCDQNLPDAWKYARELREMYQDEENFEGRDPSLEDLTETLKSILERSEKVVLFLDALNESEQHENLTEVIRKLCCVSKVRILISSTQALDFVAIFEDAGSGPASHLVDVVEMPVFKVDLDIADYVSTVVSKTKRLKHASTDLKQKIYEKIAVKARGSFRWAECQVNAIVQRSRSAVAIESALDSMAPDLESFYAELMRQFPTEDARPTRMALLWLTFAIRPLHIDEMAEAMGLGESCQFADPSERLFRETAEEMLRNCRGLIDYDASTKTAQLEHDSVKQFLLAKKCQNSQEFKYFFIDPIEDMGLLCSLMLRYLNLPRLSSGYCSKDEMRLRLENSPLLEYISFALPRHLETSEWDASSYGRALEDDLKKLTGSALLPCGGNFGTWVQVTGDPWDDLSRAPLYPFYHMAKRGHVRILKLIIGWDGDKDMEKSAGTSASTPLHAACFRGHTEVVRLLLSMGANPNETNGNGTSGLGWAVRYNFPEIVEMMLQHGARPKTALGTLAEDDLYIYSGEDYFY